MTFALASMASALMSGTIFSAKTFARCASKTKVSLAVSRYVNSLHKHYLSNFASQINVVALWFNYNLYTTTWGLDNCVRNKALQPLAQSNFEEGGPWKCFEVYMDRHAPAFHKHLFAHRWTATQNAEFSTTK